MNLYTENDEPLLKELAYIIKRILFRSKMMITSKQEMNQHHLLDWLEVARHHLINF
jgi:hypothetical protein